MTPTTLAPPTTDLDPPGSEPTASGVPVEARDQPGRPGLLAAVGLTAKLLLAACLVHAVLRPELPQYQEKAMAYRLVLYPLVAALVPLVWAIRRRRGSATPFPWLVDLCATAPFLLDSGGNAWHLYDTVEWWDDAMHVATWVPWVAGFGLLVAPRIRDRWVLAAVIVGFGSVTHVLWEIAEYLSFVQQNQTESLIAYRDTIGDLALSLVGTILGAALVAATRPGDGDRLTSAAGHPRPPVTPTMPRLSAAS